MWRFDDSVPWVRRSNDCFGRRADHCQQDHGVVLQRDWSQETRP